MILKMNFLVGNRFAMFFGIISSFALYSIFSVGISNAQQRNMPDQIDLIQTADDKGMGKESTQQKMMIAKCSEEKTPLQAIKSHKRMNGQQENYLGKYEYMYISDSEDLCQFLMTNRMIGMTSLVLHTGRKNDSTREIKYIIVPMDIYLSELEKFYGSKKLKLRAGNRGYDSFLTSCRSITNATDYLYITDSYSKNCINANLDLPICFRPIIPRIIW